MTITNELIQQILATAREYCVFILKEGANRNQPDAEQIQGEHIRYLFELRADGKLSITCPVMNNSGLMGVGILNTSDLDEAKKILDQDPNIKAGRLTYEAHICISFPGDSLAE